MRNLREILKEERVGGTKRVLDEKTVFFAFDKVFRAEYGAQGCISVVPKRFSQGEILVSAKNSLWLSEVLLAERDLLSRINAFLGQEGVKKIRLDSTRGA